MFGEAVQETFEPNSPSTMIQASKQVMKGKEKEGVVAQKSTENGQTALLTLFVILATSNKFSSVLYSSSDSDQIVNARIFAVLILG